MATCSLNKICLFRIFVVCLWTDCQSVVRGLSRPAEWAASSKRKYSRIWVVVHGQVENQPDCVQWMPAHTSQSAVGQLACGDGTLITEDMRCSNQICDSLAKDAASAIQLSSFDRSKLVHNIGQLRELLIYLGRLTHVANHFVRADGSIIRDSTADKVLAARRRKSTNSSTPNVVVQSKGASSSRAKVRRPWHFAFRARVRPLVRRGRPCGASSIAQTRKLVADRKEEEFQFWWREERSQTLKQPDGVPLSAKERMEALRARIVAKSGSAQSASSVAPCAES